MKDVERGLRLIGVLGVEIEALLRDIFDVDEMVLARIREVYNDDTLINSPQTQNLFSGITGNQQMLNEIMEIFEDIHDNGNTVIMVTHEEYIAEHSDRIIRLRDGIIERDEAN